MEFLNVFREAIIAYYSTNAQHPDPHQLPLRYGTSGFRTIGTLIPPVAARITPVAVLRSLQCGACVGVMITASHNPANDNGIKVVDSNGGMLDASWEPFCTEMANTTDGETLFAVLEKWVKELNITIKDASTLLPPSSVSVSEQRDHVLAKLAEYPQPFIHIGHDTRSSGADINGAVTAVLKSVLHVRYVDHGICTTPQLHTMVHLQNTKAPIADKVPCEQDYFDLVLNALEELLPSRPDSDIVERDPQDDLQPSPSWDGNTEIPPPPLYKKQVLVVDGANGVGALKLKALLSASHARGHEHDVLGMYFRFVILNDRLGDMTALNAECGADHCQRTKQPSAAMKDWRVDSLQKYMDSKVALKIPAYDEVHYYALDGDADRVVAFHHSGDANPWSLLDGDRFAILYAMLLNQYIHDMGDATAGHNLDIGIVQTAYANGASTEFVKSTLKLPTYCTATGVKNLHPVAHARDCGVYFEANGHGTMLIKEQVAEKVPTLQHLSRLLSQVCGDAIADMLACELALKVLKVGEKKAQMTFNDWLKLYSDWPSVQTKVQVPNPSKMTTTPDEQTVLSPEGLQERINAAVQRAVTSMNNKSPRSDAGERPAPLVARSFVRPSGTEPIVRVYAEATEKDEAVTLALEVEQAVRECMA